MRRKITSVLVGVGLAGAMIVGGASTASAATHWSGNYPTLSKCNLGRLAYQNYGYRTSSCYKSSGPSGTSYHFYWYS